ncbi:MAG TPA: hypothetical protein VNK89_00950 [Thermoflexus sp.]|nr:hypothetical protein [Thermoflexus sp.]
MRKLAQGVSTLFFLFTFWGGTFDRAIAQSGQWLFPLSPLGVSEPVVLAGPSAEQTVSIPVPKGLRPIRLFARVRSSPGAIGASLQIRHEGRTLQWVRLTTSEMRVVIPLEEAQVVSSRLLLLLRLEASELASDCAAPERIRVELDRLEVEMEGALEPPDQVAEFWPPVLRALHIQLPDPPSPEEAMVALRLAALGARLAAGHLFTLTVSSTAAPPFPVDDPWSRWVRISRDGTPRLALAPSEAGRMPILEIAGPPGSLEASLEALIAYPEAFQAPSIFAVEGAPPRSVLGDLIPLAALGYPQIQMSGSGTMETTIFFSQADLGGPVRGVELRLAGRATPIPPGGQAQLLVLLNGGLVYAEPVAGGSFDRWISMPDGLLRRDNNLVVRVVYTPPGGECRVGVHPITVFIDGASYFQFQKGTHLPAGFERLPQGLLPTFTVGLDPLNPETIEAAAQLIAVLQRTTRTMLIPRVQAWPEAIAASGPLLLVTLDPGKVSALRPPLDPRPFRVIDVDGRELFRMEIDRPFAVMEAFHSGGREILLLTRHGDRPDLRGIERALDPQLGWYGLTGDVWIWPDGEAPVAMRLRGGGLRVVPLAPSSALRWEKIRFWVMGAALIGAVLFLLWIYPRVVRKAPPGSPQPQ